MGRRGAGIALVVSLGCGSGEATSNASAVAAVDLAVGGFHACVVTKEANAVCWGSNWRGEVGTGAVSFAEPRPRRVAGLEGVAELALGEDHSCALLRDGTVSCWGQNENGELGDGTLVDRATPAPVHGIRDVVEIAAGGGRTCARQRDGAVFCWGYLSPVEGHVTPTPARVPTLARVRALAVNGWHACALLDDGTVSCWGENTFGELGDGTRTDSAEPHPVVGLASVTSIAVGGGYSCALLADATARCWGTDLDGQLGDGVTKMQIPPLGLHQVLLEQIAGLSANAGHACATTTNSGVACWGWNISGQLGNGTVAPDPLLPTWSNPTPALVSGVSGVKKLALGSRHTCALHDDGKVYCWGENNDGELGRGTRTDDVPTPGEVVW